MIWGVLIIGAVVLGGAALWLHHLFEGERLLRDIWREWRLSRLSLAEIDAKWAARDIRSDIVVSLTTIPSRIGMLETVLKGLLDQKCAPAKVILNVPGYSKREECAYVLPAFLQGLKGVEVHRCEDWGPATKVLPSLLRMEADQAVLVVDDDRIYPHDFVALADKYSQEMPDIALCFAGWVVPEDLTDRATTIWSNLRLLPPAPVRASRLRHPYEIDIVQGVMGYVVRARFFDLTRLVDFSDDPRAAFLADDVRTSALCLVPKMVVPAPGLSYLPKRDYATYKATALANLNRGTGDPEDRNNTIAIRHFATLWRVGGARQG